MDGGEAGALTHLRAMIRQAILTALAQSRSAMFMARPGPNGMITREEWEKRLDDVKIRKEDMNKIVMNFLLTVGYLEAAEQFGLETGTEHIGKVTDRMAVKTALQSGNVQDAIEKLNDIDPEILSTSPQLFFGLQHQRLIELIRNGKTEEALEFAQENLAPMLVGNQRFEDLEKTIALLAFENPSNCPYGDELLGMSQRLKIASEVNAAILTSQHLDKDADMGPNQLGEKAVYPRINNFTTAILEDPAF